MKDANWKIHKTGRVNNARENNERSFSVRTLKFKDQVMHPNLSYAVKLIRIDKCEPDSVDFL